MFPFDRRIITVLILVSYFVNRTGRHLLGVTVTVGALSLPLFYSLYTRPELVPDSLIWFILPIFIAAIFFPIRWVVFSILLYTVAIPLITIPAIPFAEVGAAYFLILGISLLSMVFTILRNLDQERIAHQMADILRAHTEIQEINDELESRVLERTETLSVANERLTNTLKMLENSNSELEQFAYIASHDLQEPLRMVTSYVQLLARRYRGKLDKDADEFIAFAVDGAARMQRMIQDLLTFSRVTTQGKNFESVDCENIFSLVSDNLHVFISEENARITKDPLPVVNGDETQLMQLFQNLISNAIKYGKHGAPEIHISALQEENNWVFSVTDNGIGIEPQYFKTIFLMFNRLQNRNDSSGVGLAICRKILERHGGRIWVESELGAGSTFYFTIPVKEGTGS